jgi:hypothetical protein
VFFGNQLESSLFLLQIDDSFSCGASASPPSFAHNRVRAVSNSVWDNESNRLLTLLGLSIPSAFFVRPLRARIDALVMAVLFLL